MPDDVCEVPETFTSQEPGTTTLPCGMVVETCEELCDTASLTIRDMGTSVTVAANSKAECDGKLTKKEKKYLDGNDVYLEVVGGPDGMKGAKPGKVDILPVVSPTCGTADHASSGFYAPQHCDSVTAQNCLNGQSNQKKLFSPPLNTDGQTLSALFGRFFDFTSHSSDYSIHTLSCGVAADGEGTEDLRGRIRAMTPDIWEVKLKMPARKSGSSKGTASAGLMKGKTTSREYVRTTDWGKAKSGGSASQSSGIGGTGAGNTLTGYSEGGPTYSTSTTSDGVSYSVVDMQQSGMMANTVTHSGGSSKITKRELAPTIAGMKVGLDVKHNGETFDVLQGINKVLNLVQTVTTLAEKMVPKVQFGWGFDFKFVEIALYARWGRLAKQKKHGDRVAILERDALVGLSGTFVFVEISLGIEAQAFGAGLVLKIAVNGQLDAKVEWTLGEGKVEGGVSGTIKGYGTGEVFIDAWFFKGGYKLLVESNLIGKWSITASEDGWKDKASAEWSGVHFYKIKTGFAAKGKQSKPSEWAKKKVLMKPRSVFTS